MLGGYDKLLGVADGVGACVFAFEEKDLKDLHGRGLSNCKTNDNGENKYLPSERSDFFEALGHIFLPIVFIDDGVQLEHDIAIVAPPTVTHCLSD